MNNNCHLSEEFLQGLRDWFTRYTGSFYTADPVLQPVLLLKEGHSRRVSGIILHIGRKLLLSDHGLRMAEVMALFHDIGRFEQVTRYGTFVDRKSVNHAELGLQVLKREKVLAGLEEDTRELILRAISYHNRLSIPAEESPDCIYYSRLLRDADKLDILALFSRYYYAEPAERSSAVELDLPDGPDVSEGVLKDLQRRKTVNMQQLRFLNDFKLLQLGWAYDVNFQPSLELIREQGYLQKIRATLPESEAIDLIYDQILSHIESRL